VTDASPDTRRRALLKSGDVCELVKVQPYVLRSWEKEFPELGTSKTAGGPRFYRQADIERVVRIKQLVFGEGLTLAGARRRLDEERASQQEEELPFDDEPTERPMSSDARARLDGIRQGLRSILELLSVKYGSANGSAADLHESGATAAAPHQSSDAPPVLLGPGAAASDAKKPRRRRQAAAG
jgi:DNA-binding transcriptional MerR regulator